MGVPQRLVSLLDKTFSCFFIRLKTRIKYKLQNGEGCRIQESQEEWLKHFCHVLTKANPRIQGSTSRPVGQPSSAATRATIAILSSCTCTSTSSGRTPGM